MSNNYINNMGVYGERSILDRFKNEMAGDYKNGPLSFKNIIPEPDEVEGLKEFDPSSDQWRINNWGCASDALWPTMTDKGEYYHYYFETFMGEVMSIYETLFAKYPDLSFHVNYNHETDEDYVIIMGKNGKIKKKDFMFWKCVPWNNSRHFDIHYKKNLLDNTTNIVDIRIFREGEYDDAYHEWKVEQIHN